MALSNMVTLVVLYCWPRKGTRDRNGSVYQDQDQDQMCVCVCVYVCACVCVCMYGLCHAKSDLQCWQECHQHARKCRPGEPAEYGIESAIAYCDCLLSLCVLSKHTMHGMMLFIQLLSMCLIACLNKAYREQKWQGVSDSFSKKSKWFNVLVAASYGAMVRPHFHGMESKTKSS